MNYLIIDGAQGEGGGQVLRTALTLSMLTKQAIEVVNIRAKRKKPGLLRQHLTCVLAAQQICDAETAGVELGSNHIRFAPKQIKAGDYHFAIGTAGSTTLVCQTVLLALATAKQPSTITFEGGTHNGMSPSLCFFEHCYLPALAKMGVYCELTVTKYGFYPAGGGKWQLTIYPCETLKPFAHFAQPTKDAKKAIKVLVNKLPGHVAKREISTVKQYLDWTGAETTITRVESIGAGNSLQLQITSDTHNSIFEVIGQHGIAAQKVALKAVEQVTQFTQSAAAVEEHLADQLLLPLALAGKGEFKTSEPSLHSLTNAEVIKALLYVEITFTQLDDNLWQVSLTDT